VAKRSIPRPLYMKHQRSLSIPRPQAPRFPGKRLREGWPGRLPTVFQYSFCLRQHPQREWAEHDWGRTHFRSWSPTTESRHSNGGQFVAVDATADPWIARSQPRLANSSQLLFADPTNNRTIPARFGLARYRQQSPLKKSGHHGGPWGTSAL